MYTVRDLLVKEHREIERNLDELEMIMHQMNPNLPNLLHTLRKIGPMWDQHEEKENIFFHELSKKGFPIPVKRISFEHGKLKQYREALLKALESGSQDKTKDTLLHQGKELINKLRKHIKDEDWIFYALPKTKQI